MRCRSRCPSKLPLRRRCYRYAQREQEKTHTYPRKRILARLTISHASSRSRLSICEMRCQRSHAHSTPSWPATCQSAAAAAALTSLSAFTASPPATMPRVFPSFTSFFSVSSLLRLLHPLPLSPPLAFFSKLQKCFLCGFAAEGGGQVLSLTKMRRRRRMRTGLI